MSAAMRSLLVRPSLAAAALAAFALAAAAPPAAADAKSAEKAFRKGKKLQGQKKYAEACAAFEDSFREDPAIGAQLNVARCFEEWGKLATAYDAYQEAHKLARATKDDRAPQIRELLERFDKKVPLVIISLPKGRLPPPGLAVTLDGNELAEDQLGQPLRLDPGEHVLVTRANEGTPHTTKINAVIGKRLPVELPIDALAPAADKPAPPEPDPPAEVVVVVRRESVHAAGRGQRIAALSIGGAGLVGFGVATYLALDARSDYNGAFDAGCQDATRQCDPAALEITSDARSQANVATLVGGVALAAVTAGVVLYLTAPRGGLVEQEQQEARYLRPLLWQGGAGLAFGGSL
jgi:tetratricopeptide (TPR) repeat protein